MAGLRRWAWVVVALAAGAAPARAESALAQVPEKAAVVVQIRGIEGAKDRFMAMVRAALPDLAGVVQAQLDKGMQDALNGRELKGLAKDGPVLVALLEVPASGQEHPKAAGLFRVTDYAAFRDGILKEEERKNLTKDPAGYEVVKGEGERPLYLLDRSGFAVITRSKDAVETFLKQQPGLDGKLGGPAADRLLESDVGIYVDLAAVRKQYEDQIQGIRQLIPMMMGQMEGKMDKRSVAMLNSFTKGVFQLLDDGRSWLLTLDFRPEGLAFHTEGSVGAESKSNAFLKDSQPASLADIGKLPAGQLGYGAVEFGPRLAKIYEEMMAGGEGAQGAADAQKELGQAAPRSMLVDFNLPPAGIQVWRYEDPAKAADAQRKVYESLNAGSNFQGAILKDKPEVKPDAETHEGFKLTSVHLTYDFDKMMEALPEQARAMAQSMKKIAGDGVNLWTGTDGKVVVQLTGKDWDVAKKQLDNYVSGRETAAGSKPFGETLKHLPERTTMLTVVDLPLYVQKMAEFMGPALKGQVPVDLSGLKADAGKSYLGAAVTLQPERGSLDVWVPTSAVVEIRKMLEPVLGGHSVR